jgi:thioester reductase-like protein
VGGSRNVIALAGECRDLRRLDYVGTAYVAGKRSGVIGEDDLDAGQEHNNTYEKTKMESEAEMRRAAQRLPVTVFRPSIVICDSRTGGISRYSAFFRMLSAYNAGLLPALPGAASTMLDIVPMDFVAGAIGAIARAALGSSLQVPRLSTYFGKMAAFVMASA